MPDASLKLHVRFFAVLREQSGRAAAEVETAAPTPAALYAELQAKYPLTFPVALLRVSINERYAELTTLLRTGDRVVFIPPVAGG